MEFEKYLFENYGWEGVVIFCVGLLVFAFVFDYTFKRTKFAKTHARSTDKILEIYYKKNEFNFYHKYGVTIILLFLLLILFPFMNFNNIGLISFLYIIVLCLGIMHFFRILINFSRRGSYLKTKKVIFYGNELRYQIQESYKEKNYNPYKRPLNPIGAWAAIDGGAIIRYSDKLKFQFVNGNMEIVFVNGQKEIIHNISKEEEIKIRNLLKDKLNFQ